MKFKKRYVIVVVVVIALYFGRNLVLGYIYQNIGDNEKAKSYLQKTEATFESILGKTDLYVIVLQFFGSLYINMGDNEKAESYLLEAKAIWERLSGKIYQDYANSINKLGKLYYDMDKYEKAEEYYLETIAIREKAFGKEHPEYATSLNILGGLYYDMGDYVKAENYLLEAKDIREKALGKEHQDYATSLNNLGWLYYYMDDYEKAENYLLEAKDVMEKVFGKEHPEYATSLNDLGKLHYYMDDYEKAENYLLEAKAVREKALGKEHQDYATSLNDLVLLYYYMGDYEKVENYLLETKAVREKALGKEHQDYATSLNDLGWLYSDMGNYEKAESYLLEVNTVREKIFGKDHTIYANSLYNLGELYYNMGDYEKAEKYYLEAIAIREKVLGKEHRDYATSLNDLGWLYYYIDDYEKAKKYYLEAKAIREKVLGKEHRDYATSLNNLGVLYRDIGDYEKAESYLLEVKAVREKVLGKEHTGYATSLNDLGWLYNDMDDYEKAEKYLLEAKAVREKVLYNEHPDFILSLDNLSMLYLTMKEYKQALVYKKETNQLNKNLIDRYFSFLLVKEREKYWKTKSFSFDACLSLSWFHPVPESHALSYNAALLSKGLLLRSTNAILDSISSSGDQSLIKQYEEFLHLRRQIGALRQRGDMNKEYIQELDQKTDNLEKSLTQASTPYRELIADLALSWEDVRDSLQTGEAAIEFVSFYLFDKKWTGKNNYAALVLRHGMETPAFVPLCEETALAELFTKLDGKGQREQARILYEEDGSSLYSLVWQPFEKTLEGVKTVYYSPSGLLHKLSFNAIPVKGNVLLSSVYDLNLVSRTSEIAHRNDKTAKKPGSAVLYGGLVYDAVADKLKQGTQNNIMPNEDIKHGDPFPYLIESFHECWKIQQRFSVNNIPVDLYTSARGNEESFKNIDGKKTSVIHLATHGFFKEMERLESGKKVIENPLLRSGLALAGANNAWNGKAIESVEDGILYAYDITNINLTGADLVVLSAYDTSLGVANNSESVYGVQRAFKLAGADTIVMSLWKVDDQATVDFMVRFYENWLSGRMNKQEAFKKAQWWLRSREEYSSPYYWAAFVMMD
jgi:CHAT domain-containing protein/uncharacterized protein HemY